jgi:DNA-binding GntR family transcriptional regulator
MLADLRQRVLQAVREDIYTYRLRPGQRLDRSAVAARTGVSGRTVREALRDLSEEGWLTSPDDDAVVRAPSRDEAAEVDEVRRALEEVMVHRFVAQASDSQVRALHHALAEFEATAGRPADPAALMRARDHFYGVILRAAGAMSTLNVLVKLRAQIILLMCAALCLPGRPQVAAAELREIYEALADRDADRAAKACATHLARSYEAAFQAIEATGIPSHS